MAKCNQLTLLPFKGLKQHTTTHFRVSYQNISLFDGKNEHASFFKYLFTSRVQSVCLLHCHVHSADVDTDQYSIVNIMCFSKYVHAVTTALRYVQCELVTI